MVILIISLFSLPEKSRKNPKEIIRKSYLKAEIKSRYSRDTADSRRLSTDYITPLSKL